MKNKLILPYKEVHSRRFNRGFLSLTGNIGSVYYQFNGWSSIIYNGAGFYKEVLVSKEIAMQALDEELIKRGFILLSEEQAEKYKLLI